VRPPVRRAATAAIDARDYSKRQKFEVGRWRLERRNSGTFRWAQPGAIAAIGADSLKAAATGRDKRVPEKRKGLAPVFLVRAG
jgi:hypothetical protein